MSIKKHIPNAITCCNLLCGCLAIVQAFEGNLVYSAYLVGLGAIFDFFDGFAARMLRVASPIGKDLDSLTDMVTFGVVPGVIMFHMIDSVFLWNNGVLEYFADGSSKILLPNELLKSKSLIKYLAFIIPVFSAIRLAKFNNDARQSDSFIGVPTPAVAIFICSLALIYTQSYVPFINIETCHQDYEFVQFLSWLFTPIVLCIISSILSILLISEIPLFALKFRNFSWRGNRIRYSFLGLSLLLLITLQYFGIPVIIILYILMSVITNFYLKRRTAS